MAKLPNGGMRCRCATPLLKRPDLLEKAELSQKDRWLVAQMKAEQAAKDGNDSNAAQTDGETDRK